MMPKANNTLSTATRRKPLSFTAQDLELLKETLRIPHESRTLVFEYLAHTVSRILIMWVGVDEG